MDRNEAIKIVKSHHPVNKQMLNEALEFLIPELAESKDERIRKALIDYFDDANKADENPLQSYGIHTDKAIAWLETQGEKFLSQDGSVKGFAITEPEKYFGGVSEPIEATAATYTAEVETGDGGIKALVTGKVVMPKFKVGDWIANDYCMGKVIELTNDAYLLDTGQGIPFSCEHNAHLWTIQDAKDGDVLATDDWVFIFKKINSNVKPVCYCHYDIELGFRIDKNSYISTGSEIYPATKEQRNLLFQKMKEAGYVWDAKKKELKKIEQKPWSEEDERTLQGIWDEIIANKHDAKEYEWKTYDKFLDWLKSLKDRVQPRQEWNEEDERMRRYVVNDLRFVKEIANDPNYAVSVERVEKEIEWMESIKNLKKE